MHDVGARNCLEAWREAVRLLLRSRAEMFHLITEIEEPCHFEPRWLAQYSPHLVVAGADRMADVMSTIFPVRLWQRTLNRNALYASYLVAHRRGMRRPANRARWGTYFERLIAFGGTDGPNQLEIAIQKLAQWRQRYTTAFVFHLSAPTTDGPRPMGGPCLQFAEILWRPGGIIDLAVVYRNHDFFNKAFANFIGLGQLLAFIAGESNKIPGRLICHSMHAYSEASNAHLRQLARVA